MVDASKATINRFLRGPSFTPQVTSPTLHAQLKNHDNQQEWLSNLLAEGTPGWLTNPSERIFKASLTLEAKFWWGVVHTHLMPTNRDNIMGDDRAILVTTLVANVSLDIGKLSWKILKSRYQRPTLHILSRV